MKRILLVFLLFSSMACSFKSHKTSASYINPFIGTDFHGHTFPGATVPFGLVQLSPDTGTEGWDWCSGYHSSDNSIMGFSHSHLSGTGAADLGDILFMPTNSPEFIPGSKDNPDGGYRSRFRHETEIAEAGYYSVYLDDVSVKVELTSSAHSGIQKYTFDDVCDHFVTVDLSHGISDAPLECYIRKVSEYAIEGYRRSAGWADEHTVFFYSEFSQPIQEINILADENTLNGDEAKAVSVVSSLKFSHDISNIIIKTGISYVDIEGAKSNLDYEIGSSNFDEVRSKAFDSWEQAVSTVQVEGDENRKEIFYTALYHSMISPFMMSDIDGRYRSSDRNVYKSETPNYGLFSTWDTFRALHPLLTIIAPERNTQFVNSMIRYYEQSGRLPVWDLNMRENFCMIGYHSIPIITDAYFKGEKIDSEKALEAMLRSSTEDTYLGLGHYRHYHYMPYDLESNSVSKALEFAYDDWCIAMFAKSLGKYDIYEEYIKRAQYYKNHLDSVDTFMKGRDSNGRFRKNFSPTQVYILGQNDFTEGNSWHYSFFVPQDVNTLIQLMGGDKKFVEKLDELFSSKSVTDNASPDVSGLIGNYAHGNEPSHHSAYLYAYAGEQWKTAEKVSRICSEMYTNRRDGLCGNEDCGQMSAWYVMSSMGFYEVTPGSCNYVLGSPQFENIVINNDNGSKFEIIADGLSERNIYISDVLYNGKPYLKSYITHDMIVSGGSLVLKMQSTPNEMFGADKDSRPVSVISDYVMSSDDFLSDITFNPYVDVEERFFEKEITITPQCENDAIIYYTINGTDPSSNGKISGAPIRIHDDCILKMVAKRKDTGKYSSVSTYCFNKGRILAAEIKFPQPDSRFLGKGAKTLTDGLSGGTTHLSGGWLGWNGGDITFYVQLPHMKHVSYVGVDFLASIYDWIVPPSGFTVEFEKNDGSIGREYVSIPEDAGKEHKTCLFGVKCDVLTKTIRIVIPQNVLPSWHRYHGSTAWVFIDEILVK